MKEASSYLDKLPEIKQVLNENADAFIAAGAATLSGRTSGVQEIFTQIKDAAQGDQGKNKEKMKELRDLVLRKAREAREQGSAHVERGLESLQNLIRTIGGEDVPDMKVFVRAYQDRGDDAKKLVEDTYKAIFKVLEEKGKEAKRLSEEAKDDTKKKS